MADGDGVMLQAVLSTAGDRSGREVRVTFDAGRISWESEASSTGEGAGLTPDSKRTGEVVTVTQEVTKCWCYCFVQ